MPKLVAADGLTADARTNEQLNLLKPKKYRKTAVGRPKSPFHSHLLAISPQQRCEISGICPKTAWNCQIGLRILKPRSERRGCANLSVNLYFSSRSL